MLNNIKEKKTKTNKTFSFYYRKLYDNFEKSEKIKERIVDIDIIMSLIEKKGIKQYKIFLQPKRGLPNILIKNIGVFFIFCAIHGFFPNINGIIIKNGTQSIDLENYNEIVFITRLIHLIFIKGFDFVLYDMVNKFMKNKDIDKIFKDNGINLLSEGDFLSLINIIKDVKNLGFDMHKHHFHENLGKLSNRGIFSEIMFLETAMKYENKIIEYVGFDNTYLKPSSYKEDIEGKTDFNFIYSIDSANKKHIELPIQFTVSSNDTKLIGVKNNFLKCNKNKFCFIQVFGNLKRNFKKIEEDYQSWILDSKNRENMDPTIFPFFINQQGENNIENIIIYFYLHKIIKNKNNEQITKFTININGINFNQTSITYKKKYSFVNKKNNLHNKYKIQENIYSIKYKGKEIGKITFLVKINKS